MTAIILPITTTMGIALLTELPSKIPAFSDVTTTLV